MKETTTSGFVAVRMENPALELEDFERLVEQYRTRVLRFVFASVRDMDLAETLTQDCFWNAYKNRAPFRGDCSVSTWLIKIVIIVINLIRDHTGTRRFQFWKKAQRVHIEEIQDWPVRSVSPEEKAAVNEQVRAVWEATKTLSDRQRTVFLLRNVRKTSGGWRRWERKNRVALLPVAKNYNRTSRELPSKTMGRTAVCPAIRTSIGRLDRTNMCRNFRNTWRVFRTHARPTSSISFTGRRRSSA